MLSPEIKISDGLDTSNALTLSYEIGSYKVTENNNKILNNAFLQLTTLEEGDVFDLIKEGNYIFIDDELTFIINNFKKSLLNKKSGINKWTVPLELVDLNIILQKIILPNKTITQPISSTATQKNVKTEMEKLVEVYAPQYRGYTNWVVDYPNENEIVDEYKWTQPTLFEALCDLASDSNLTPKVTYDGTYFRIGFENLTSDGGEQIDLSNVNGLEINGLLDNSPQRMVNVINNSISTGTAKSYGVHLKSEIGVLDDADSSVYLDTPFNINTPVQIIVRGTVSETFTPDGTGHTAGSFEYDITDYVLEKSVFNSLETYYGTGVWKSDINNYSNGNLYYIKGEKNIYGAKVPYKVAWTIGDGIYTIINILNHISRYNTDKIISSTVTGQVWAYFFNEDLDDMVFDLEYKIIDNVRYDIIKDEGYGSIVQNQNDAFINFINYKKQEENLMNRLGSDEVIIMGRVFNEDDVPKYGQLYGEKLIIQTTKIYDKNSINFMLIATSKFNRVDSDAVINTKKRFFQITSATETLERNEFYTKKIVGSNIWDEVVNDATHFLVQTYDENNSLITSVYLNFLKEKIDDSNYLFVAKTLDNKYASLTLNESSTDNITYIKGVYYTDEDGTFDHATIALVKINVDLIGNDAWKNFPLPASNLQSTPITSLTDTFKYKDTSEKMAFSILFTKNSL